MKVFRSKSEKLTLSYNIFFLKRSSGFMERSLDNVVEHKSLAVQFSFFCW